MSSPNTRPLRFVIMGAGMSGILSAIKLREAGFDDVTIYEKADRIGGTWRENTYPGLTCDVPSHAYTYSFEPNPDWTRALPPGSEIQDYFERTVDRYGIRALIRFNQEITRCAWEDGRWRIATAAGITDAADVVIAATGVLHHPSHPRIEGLDSFAGACFHSARWDHSVPLDGKRIGVIGNGSTGVQIVSALTERAAKLSHFQRTPQWIMAVENPFFTEEQKAAFRADRALLTYMQNEPSYLAGVARFTNAIVNIDGPGMAEIENLVLANLETNVHDPVLREKLRPAYRAACKRLIYSPDYYRWIQHPHAELVTEAIERVEPAGIRTRDGRLHELDVLALATGFHADRFMRPMNVTGRNGVRLDALWAERPTAYLAIALPDFPNFFMLNGPGGPVGNFSLIDVAEHQWNFVSRLIERLSRGECRAIAPTAAAFTAYEERRHAAARRTIFGSGCNSWYLDSSGVPATWPWTQERFREEMAEPRAEDFEFA